MSIAETAKQNFLNGFNCAQAVAAAFADALGVEEATLLCAAEGFGGGMGRMRLTCGAVSGMAMLAGLKYGTAKPGDTETRTKIYDTVRLMAAEFEQIHGSIICADLLSGVNIKDNTSSPERRTTEYYKKRPCAECVYDCAAIAEKYLL